VIGHERNDIRLIIDNQHALPSGARFSHRVKLVRLSVSRQPTIRHGHLTESLDLPSDAIVVQLSIAES
jgi:hypothetical protein